MNSISKNKALELYKKLIDAAHLDKDEIDTWARNALVATQKIFGNSSSQAKAIEPHVNEIFSTVWLHKKEHPFNQIKILLESYYYEVKELFPNDESRNSKSKKEIVDRTFDKAQASKDIFLVHGHDHGNLEMVARYVEKLKLNPIILHEKASLGTTIIEKLEKYSNVSYAIILLTPDDIGASSKEPNKLRPRARQNVVFELGYFLAKLGRRRVCAIIVEGIEIPSDYAGILYISLDKEGAWKLKLIKEFKAIGLPIDNSAII